MTEQTMNEVRLEDALKERRLAANLSIGDVAEKLNLKCVVIRDIENNLDEIIADDRYSKIYLRGYLSNYGKMLELPLIESFPQYQRLLHPQKSAHYIKNQMPVQQKRKSSFKMLCLLLLIGLFIAGYLWATSANIANDESLMPFENAVMQLPAHITDDVTEVEVIDSTNIETNASDKPSTAQPMGMALKVTQ